MDDAGHLLGEPLLRPTTCQVGGMGRLDGLNLVEVEEGEHAEELARIAVVGPHPVLVEGEGRGERGVEPDRIAGRLAELLARGGQQQRRGDGVGLAATLLVDELDAGGDVAPLVVAAHLELHAFVAVEHEEVVGLQQHVAELGVGDALVALLEPAPDRLLGDHRVDREVLAHIPQPVEVGDGAGPVGVVDHLGRVAPLEAQEGGELGADGGKVGEDGGVVEQVALRRAAARVANHAGRAAHHGDGPVPCPLQMGHHHDGHKVAHMEAPRRGVEAHIEADLLTGEEGGQAGLVGDLLKEAAAAQQFDGGEHLQLLSGRSSRRARSRRGGRAAGRRCLRQRWPGACPRSCRTASCGA